MYSSSSMMQENVLFDASVEKRQEGVEQDAVELVTCVKCALDQRISRLETVVEGLTEEVLHLRGRLRECEGTEPCGAVSPRASRDAVVDENCGPVEPWEDPPKGHEASDHCTPDASAIIPDSQPSLWRRKLSSKTCLGGGSAGNVIRQMVNSAKYNVPYIIGAAVAIFCFVASVTAFLSVVKRSSSGLYFCEDDVRHPEL